MAFEYLSPSQKIIPPVSEGIVGITQWTFRMTIIVIGLMAFVFLLIVGFQYVITAKVTEKGHLRQRIQEIIIGLILALLSFAILQFINPRILNLDAVNGLTPVGRNDPNLDDIYPYEDPPRVPNPPQTQPQNPYIPPTQNPNIPTIPTVGDGQPYT
jgi:hypothetical protein